MFRSMLIIIRYSFKASAVRSSLIAVFSAFFTCVPSAQVLLMATLLAELSAARPNLPVVLAACAGIVVLVGLIAPLRAIREYLVEMVELDTGAELQGLLADRASVLTPEEVEGEDLGSQIEGHSRAIVDHISRAYSDALLAAEAILGAAGLVITLSTYSGTAGALTALSLVPTLMIGFYLSKSQKRMWLHLGRIYRRERYIRETLSSRSALLELTAFGTMGRIGQLEKDAQARICEVRKQPLRVGLAITGLAAVVNAVLFGLAIYAVFAEVGFVAAAIAALYGVFGAVNAIAQGGSQIANLVRYAPTVAGLVSFLERPQADSREPAGWKITDLDHLELDSIDVSYGQDRLAVRGASLRVERGEMVAIVGRNGAGKTTLLKSLLGLAPITGGAIYANGHAIEPAAQEWWLRGFGAMAQDYGKYEVTVEDSVRLGRPGDTDTASIRYALEAARAQPFVDALPERERTQLGEVWGGTGLSGGQWQRLALARVYLRNARVWILDEPSSAIDAETEIELFDELRRTSGERSTIVVSHRAWTLRRMDRIYVMDDGQVVEEGGFQELLEMNGHFARLFREQTHTRPQQPKSGMEVSDKSGFA